MAGPMTFVGRERELSRLMGALGGDARLVLVVGDAGVGKTRFAAEGVTRATATGMVMARGECLPLAGTLPLLPVASALGELGRLRGGGLVESALAAAPGFVRAEVGRLVPGLVSGGSETGAAERDEGWRRGRLFAGVAELLAAVARESPSGLGLVVEDVQWADNETLDFLTFLGRAGSQDPVRVVVTCRSDEAPVAAEVAAWLAQVRGTAGVAEIRLGPLSRAEVAGQVAALAGEPVAAGVLDELFVRAEGNPFFTEQLVAAALADREPGGGLQIPAGLPDRLVDVLVARASRGAGDAREMLDAMAVAGRTVDEDLLGAVTGLDIQAVRQGLAELAAARLLADDAPGGGHRLRHALLAEAIACGLLPGVRAGLHERIARALETAGDQALAGEAAARWQAAGQAGRELPARIAAAGAAERVFGFADAAAHWQRAIGLWPDIPDAASRAGIGLPEVYVRAIDTLYLSGESGRAGELAEEAYRRFARHRDPAVAAIARHRAGLFRLSSAPPASARPLLEEALRLFEQAPASAEHAAAQLDYALSFRDCADSARNQADVSALLNKALEVAEAAGATALTSRAVANLGYGACLSGRVEEGAALLDRGRALAQASQDGMALVRQAMADCEAQLKLARFPDAAEVAMQGVDAVRQAGLDASWQATQLAWFAAVALLALGRTAAAEALIGPLTTGPPDLDHFLVHEARAEIDLLRGDIEAAGRRRQQVKACIPGLNYPEYVGGLALRAAELALWAGSPADALREVQQVLPLFRHSDLTISCGLLLATGMRACADLAEQARARRDPAAAEDAVVAADGLACWLDQVGGAPFTDHPFFATIPAERATWEAERTRLAGASDPAAWATAAKTWDGLGCVHRAGYAWWRRAQAQLDARQPAAAALRAAAAAADGHEPLLARVRALAERARIALQAPATGTPPSAGIGARYGLTGRELAVLRLLAAGRTNAQIGAELFISPRTAGVHVTNILRKLGVSGRVQAAALAERAGLLADRYS